MMVNDPNAAPEARSWVRALGRGFAKRCPRCGRGTLFSGFLTNAVQCSTCGLDFTGHRADDAPPYVTIMIVGHLIVPLALLFRQLFEPALWIQFALWTPLILIATIWLMPRSKGAMIGIQWANEMHGFARDTAERA
ncbi:MAG: DUF983 domain-containing protein [Pseudomonadota bacterium]